MREIELQQHQPPPPPPGQWDQFTRQAAIVILLLGVLFLIFVLRPLIKRLGITGIFILILSYSVNKLRSKTKLAYPVTVLAVFIPLAILLFILVGNEAGWFVGNAKDLVTALQPQAVLWGVIGVILVIPLPGTVREALNYVLRKINRQDPYPGEEPQTGFWAQEITSK